MDVVLGLGNPGARYRATRHNVGFHVVDRLAARARVSYRRDDGVDALLGVGRLSGRDVVLAKPETFMNRSGQTAAALWSRCDPCDDRMVVVVDDADLALGRIRIRPRGGSGGHNGLESIAESLGTEEFVRVRVGVAGVRRPAGELADYVLSAFEPDETERVEDAIRGAADAVEEILPDGVGPAMNRWNGRVLSPEADGPDEGSSTQS